MATLSDIDRQNIQDVFAAFDTDRDQRLDFHELSNAMRALGFEPSKREVLDLISRYDPVSKRYISLNEFQQEMTRLIADRDPLDEVRRAFYMFSPDGSGITVEALRNVTKDLGEAISEEELRAMISEFDLDEDGRISLDEFIRICTK